MDADMPLQELYVTEFVSPPCSIVTKHCKLLDIYTLFMLRICAILDINT